MDGIKLACFDLDDTLIRDRHSVLIPCILNGKEKECREIDAREMAGELDYISADYLKAELFKGLVVSKIEESFTEIAIPLGSIRHVVDELHKNGIMCIVVTVGPVQVVKAFCDIYRFDGYYGSEYDVENGVFTGLINKYLSAESKIECLRDYCIRFNIALSECVAVGDGATDIPVFEQCRISIALNASASVQKRATYAVDTLDLVDILQFIL